MSYETYPYTVMIGINPFEGLWSNFSEPISEGFQKLNKIVPEYRRNAWTNGLKALGIDDPAYGEYLGEFFAAERRKRPFVYDETFAVLEQLKGKYELLLLTNGDPSLQRRSSPACLNSPLISMKSSSRALSEKGNRMFLFLNTALS